MKLDEMSRDERSLLLFLEAVAVDSGGRVDIRHMNPADMEIAKRWDKEGFVRFGRIASEYILEGQGTHWCKPSDEAFVLAHEERRAKAGRVWTKRVWKTTEENH